MEILAEGERAVSNTNRNFVGRIGHVESEDIDELFDFSKVKYDL